MMEVVQNDNWCSTRLGESPGPGFSNNMKINKIMEYINKKASKKDIVLLILSIAEKPEIATDFNINLSHYLKLFLRTKDELNLSDAGIFILNTTRIYARRIDYVHDDVVKMAIGLKPDAIEAQEKITVNNKIPKKVIHKRSLLDDGNLVEMDMSPKQFKKTTEDKLFENEMNSTCFEAPQHFFSMYKKYKEFHTVDKKRKKHSNTLISDFVNPNLWKNSRIFDYDFEDDIDSKRNYRIFKHHIERRYNTLINDINFVMYFKIKDFVDASAEQTEMDSAYDNNVSLLNSNWNSLNYLTIENKILANENQPSEKYFKQHENSRNKEKINRLGTNLINNININISLKKIDMNKDYEFDSGRSTENSSYDDFSNQNAIDEPSINLTNEIVQSTINDEINFNNCLTLNSCNEFEDSLIFVDNEENSVPDNDDKVDEIFDKNKIIVRLSVDDEGVCFGDLDDIDKMMLSPRIIATDISKYIDTKDISNFKIPIDDSLKNLFGIDDFYLNAKQHFVLPDQVMKNKKLNLKYNIFKLPKKLFRSKKHFKLTDEFKLFIDARSHKRQFSDNNNPVPAKIIRLEFLQSPEPEEVFRGFSQQDIYDDYSHRTRFIEKHRSASLDSGISRDNLDSADIIDSTFQYEESFLFTDVMETIPNKIENIRSEYETNCNEFNCIDLSQNQLSETLLLNDTQISMNTIENEVSNYTYGSHSTHSRIQSSLTIDEDSTDFGSNMEDSVNMENHEENNKMINKVQNWHRHLKPILAKSKERDHFKIFDLGSEIINKYSNGTNVITFDNVMHNKDPSFTSRYFLSVLLLANANNVDITPENRNIYEPVDPDKIKIKLKNRKRHTVSDIDNIGLITQKSQTETVQQSNIVFSRPPKRSRLLTNNDSGILTSSELSFS